MTPQIPQEIYDLANEHAHTVEYALDTMREEGIDHIEYARRADMEELNK